MRVIAGSLGGRVFEAPAGHRTHPMGDKIRGGLFNALGDIEGLSVLDPFSGSGALAIEAVSRGASEVVAIEMDKQARDIIARNVSELKIDEQVKVIRANASSWSDAHAYRLFDLVLCDPPYDKLQLSVLQKLARHARKVTGIMVVSWPGKLIGPEYKGLELIKTRHYGDAQLLFYRALA